MATLNAIAARTSRGRSCTLAPLLLRSSGLSDAAVQVLASYDQRIGSLHYTVFVAKVRVKRYNQESLAGASKMSRSP